MDKIYPYIGKHPSGCIVLFLGDCYGICLNGKTHPLLEKRHDWNENSFKKYYYFGENNKKTEENK